MMEQTFLSALLREERKRDCDCRRWIDEVSVGEVNRAHQAHWCASGKVLNVSRALHALQAEVETVCPIGGSSGDSIRLEFATDRIPAHWIDTANATRICTTIIERSTGTVTEFVENARAITADELSEFESACVRAVADADVSVLTGSLPEIVGQGKPIELYARLLKDAPRAILDVRGPELRSALTQRPLLVKPNREELAATVGRSLETEADVISAMRELNAAGAEWVLVSSGREPTLLTSQSAGWSVESLSVDVLNPIGCGDCLAAGIAVAVSEGAEIVDAVRFGTTAAALNATDLLPAQFDRSAISQRVREVRVNSL